ncbi:Methylamine utilization protein mauG [Minicystis rosea]|nr:Methylamine utilization protein mauG [Minicystis rosea]
MKPSIVTGAVRAVRTTWILSFLIPVGIVAGCGSPDSAAESSEEARSALEVPPTLVPLKGVPVPQPAQIAQYIKDEKAAIALGKALFWDQQAGSDGQACASCHFSAGADDRVRNQLSPGLNNVKDPVAAKKFNKTASGGSGGPNYVLKLADFPFHKLANINDRDSAVVFDTDDVFSSQGVFDANFQNTNQVAADSCTNVPDIFSIGGINLRRVEPRQTPTVINAAFNFRNFWDGRANNVFNGVDPFGNRNPNARVYAVQNGQIRPIRIALENSSLASQSVGPILSPFEMSCANRTFAAVGRKLLRRRPLRDQQIDPTDSVLGVMRNPFGNGLSTVYLDMVQKAFQPRFWDSTQTVAIGGTNYTLSEANFSLFWGLAIQAYERTLVSDDSPFDRFLMGNANALTAQEKLGLDVFSTKGKCINCHHGPQLTAAGTPTFAEAQEGGLVERMLMGDDNAALYDTGFYNIGVRPTFEDRGVGGLDPFGNALSFTRQAKLLAAGKNVPDPFQVVPATFVVSPDKPVDPNERDAVDGAFKVPGLRNVALTAPYFHNGGQATLEQVVDFYNRGGDRRGPNGNDTTGFGPNRSNLDPDITALGLTNAEKAALVAFLWALTDDRVRFERAPFDHPSLSVPEGALGDTVTVYDNGGRAKEKLRQIPPVGAGGRILRGVQPIKGPF